MWEWRQGVNFNFSRSSRKCATEQGLLSPPPISESFAFKELISCCTHLLFTLGLSSFNILNFFLSKVILGGFFVVWWGFFVVLSAGLATLEAEGLYLFA